jgi:GT2 family glycosyltransferase
VIVVDSTGDRTQAEVETRWPWVRFLLVPQRMLPGAARNLAVQETDGELIAFTDADAVPAADWLDQLVAAIGDAPAVAGSVENGTPGSMTGTAQYFLEFAEWLPERQKPLFHAATCNLLVRRDAFLAAGGFDERVWPGEDTILTLRWGREGHLRFAPRAVVRHLNRTGAREFLRHQARLGVAFFHVCRATGFPYRFLGHRPIAPLAAAARTLALYRQLRPSPPQLRRAVRILPVVLIGLVAWSVGFATARET